MEQDRIAFEKWLYSDECPINPDGLLTEEINAMYMSYQSATAEANKRMAELEGEVAELNDRYEANTAIMHARTKCMNELQANNHDLRDAIYKHIAAYRYVLDVEKDYREYGIGGGTYTSDAASHANGELISSIEALVKLESATPAESLAKRDNEVIEKCAKVCDGYYVGYDSQMEGADYDDFIRFEFARDSALVMREIIRALKGK